jgi:protein-S-isoprenylcysteine O-methyltransferase Ste14
MRSVTPLVLILLVILWPTQGGVRPGFLFVSLALTVGGELYRFRAVGVAGKRTRTRGRKVKELVTAGPFAYVRNPLYIGNFILTYGLVILSGIEWLLWAFPAIFFLQYSAIVSWEEHILTTTFGEKYSRYRRHVRRWVPSLSAYDSASRHRFSFSTAWESESNSLRAVLIIFTVILAKHLFFHEHVRAMIAALERAIGV